MNKISHPFLNQAEADERRKRFGANVLSEGKKHTFLTDVIEILREPMLILLLITGTVYLALGDVKEGLVLGSSIFLVIGISLFQKIRSERALEALRQMSSPRALVVRDGAEVKIAASELVPDDLIILSEGDRIPADGEIMESSSFRADESLLTGEAVPVHKGDGDHVFSSTLVVGGRAYVRVLVTGANTEVGKIGKFLAETEPSQLRLSTEIRQLTKLFAYAGLIVCSSITIVYALTRGTWLEAFLVGLATELALLPEEFPVVLTVFMALGAWRLSKVKVLVRRPEAIERLGAVTALCVDKTGTLTLNRMTVVGTATGQPEDILRFGAFASQPNPFDPMEKAILRAAEHVTSDKLNWSFVREYALSSDLLAMTCVWRSATDNQNIVATKGAPEAIIGLCNVSESEKDVILANVCKMASMGQRVLAVARSKVEGDLPTTQRGFSFEWLGLIALEDPLRDEVPEAVALCRKAGVRVIMITGDYPETARSIAAKAGLNTSGEVLTGSQVTQLTDGELDSKVAKVNVFARMVPDQKLRIVRALQRLGDVVGMTGDGVNDAPSLKHADVGIAMGARGTDVAREASDLVLLDDNFASIVAGIRRGRMIFTNIKKALVYIISIHVPIAGLSVLSVITGWPLILLPVHIVLLELVIDPASSLLFESQEADRDPMAAPPRSLGARLFAPVDFMRSVGQGALILVSSGLSFWYYLRWGNSAEQARTIAFAILVLSNLGLIVADLTRGRPNQILRLFTSIGNSAIVICFLAILGGIFFVPAITEILKLAPVNAVMTLHAVVAAFLTSTIIGIWNWIRA
ncbi:MAG: cation-translocating P-type ATPase [Bdellovibrionales bacterium]